MEYNGRYEIFDSARINTYPLSERENKVTLENLMRPKKALSAQIDLAEEVAEWLDILAEEVVTFREHKKPAVLFTGAHLIKNGLGLLLVDLVNKGMFSLVAGNGATAIHDFELALIGETSENVPNGLENGTFGMAYEFGYINAALKQGNELRLGYGESLGKMIADNDFRKKILREIVHEDGPSEFANPDVSILAACYNHNIPFTVHVGVGTDVIDQHESFDGCAKGGCSARDFLIYAHEITKFTDGGAAINIGSAVTGPEVLLKTVSMAANIGAVPKNIMTADFDLRAYEPEDMTDESKQNYYFRDQKSVVTRIPQSYGGKGFYIQGNQKDTFVYFYQKIMEKIGTQNEKNSA